MGHGMENVTSHAIAILCHGSYFIRHICAGSARLNLASARLPFVRGAYPRWLARGCGNPKEITPSPWMGTFDDPLRMAMAATCYQ